MRRRNLPLGERAAEVHGGLSGDGRQQRVYGSRLKTFWGLFHVHYWSESTGQMYQKDQSLLGPAVYELSYLEYGKQAYCLFLYPVLGQHNQNKGEGIWWVPSLERPLMVSGMKAVMSVSGAEILVFLSYILPPFFISSDWNQKRTVSDLRSIRLRQTTKSDGSTFSIVQATIPHPSHPGDVCVKTRTQAFVENWLLLYLRTTVIDWLKTDLI